MMRSVRLFVVAAVVSAGVAIVPAARVAAAGLPSLRVGDATVVEGDAGKAVVNVPVDLSSVSTIAVTVQYTIVGGTATAGSDFAARKGKLTFPAGVATKELSVVVFGDTVVEPDELVDVHLSNPVNATIADADGSVTITNDDSDGYTGLQVNIGDVVVTASTNGTHYATLPVTLSRPAPSKIKVYYAVSCGLDPTSGLVIKQTGTLTFMAGQQTSQLQFKVPLEQAISDALAFLETIKVTLGPAVTHQSQGQGLILNSSGQGGPPPVGSIDRVSVASDGSEAQFAAPELCGGTSVRGSLQAAISGDGRYVAFTSDATNLVPDDTNGLVDVFVHDRLTGTTERVSLRSDGSQVPADGYNDMNTAYPSISADGRYVTFQSQRPLTSEGANGGLYLYDRTTGQTELVSKATDGTLAGGGLYSTMSDDGRYVAFESDGTLGTNVVQPVWPQSPSDMSVFVRDRVLGTTTLVSTSYNGQWTNTDGTAAAISGDGRYISWTSDSPNIVPGDTNGCNDLFVRDMVTGTTERADVGGSGEQIPGFCIAAGAGAISADGRYVAFSGGTFGQNQTFVRDRLLGTTELIGPDTPTAGMNTPDISGDGRYVTYRVLDNTTDQWSLLVYDRTTADTTVVGQLPDGTLPDGDVGNGFDWFKSGAISRDGNYIAFTSTATNLITDDANDSPDVFEQRIN